jgi:hypothetical protein
MTDASAGIQYSDDGRYWWDGSAWQSVDAQHAGPAAGSGEAQYSDDGNYRWDGSEWQLVDGQQGTDGQQGQDAKPDTVDWSQFPLIEALTKIDNVDDWIRHIGLDPDELNVQ